MITTPNKIIFDFSPYFGKEIKFEEFYSLKDSISSIIKNTNHLSEEMKKRLNIIPPLYSKDGRQLFENLSFEDNGIENGDIISVSKFIKKRKLRSINNKSKNETASKEDFITTDNRNTIAFFKKEENLKVTKQENGKEIFVPKRKCKCFSTIVWISVIALYHLTFIKME